MNVCKFEKIFLFASSSLYLVHKNIFCWNKLIIHKIGLFTRIVTYIFCSQSRSIFPQEIEKDLIDSNFFMIPNSTSSKTNTENLSTHKYNSLPKHSNTQKTPARLHSSFKIRTIRTKPSEPAYNGKSADEPPREASRRASTHTGAHHRGGARRRIISNYARGVMGARRGAQKRATMRHCLPRMNRTL